MVTGELATLLGLSLNPHNRIDGYSKAGLEMSAKRVWRLDLEGGDLKGSHAGHFSGIPLLRKKRARMGHPPGEWGPEGRTQSEKKTLAAILRVLTLRKARRVRQPGSCGRKGGLAPLRYPKSWLTQNPMRDTLVESHSCAKNAQEWGTRSVQNWMRLDGAFTGGSLGSWRSRAHRSAGSRRRRLGRSPECSLARGSSHGWRWLGW